MRIGNIIAPLRMTRLWLTVLWALVLSVGLAAWDRAEDLMRAAAAGQTLVLLPKENSDEDARQALASKLAVEPGVAEAVWRSPAELTRRIASRFPQSEWQALFPVESPGGDVRTADSALPWVLEVRPREPLDQLALLRAFAARREQEGSWRLVLWDDSWLRRLMDQRRALRAVAGMGFALAALLGAAALRCLAWPARGGAALVVWSAALGALAPATVASAALLAGAEVESRSLLIGSGIGFLLAAVAAPMLRTTHHNQDSTQVRFAETDRDPRDRVSEGADG